MATSGRPVLSRRGTQTVTNLTLVGTVGLNGRVTMPGVATGFTAGGINVYSGNNGVGTPDGTEGTVAFGGGGANANHLVTIYERINNSVSPARGAPYDNYDAHFGSGGKPAKSPVAIHTRLPFYVDYTVEQAGPTVDVGTMQVRCTQGLPGAVGVDSRGWSQIRAMVVNLIRHTTQETINAGIGGGTADAYGRVTDVSNGTRVFETGIASSVGQIQTGGEHFDKLTFNYNICQGFGQLPYGVPGVPANLGYGVAGTDNVIDFLCWLGPSNTPKGVNAAWVLDLKGATGGTFKLNYGGGGNTTSALGFGVAPAAIEAALDLVPTVGVDNIGVSAGSSPFTLTAINALGGIPIGASTLSIVDNLLTGGSGVATLTQTSAGETYGYPADYYGTNEAGGTRRTINADANRPFMRVTMPGFWGMLCNPAHPIDLITPAPDEMQGGATPWTFPVVANITTMARFRMNSNAVMPKHLWLGSYTTSTTAVYAGINTTSGYGAIGAYSSGSASSFAVNPEGGNVYVGMAPSGNAALSVKSRSGDGASGGVHLFSNSLAYNGYWYFDAANGDMYLQGARYWIFKGATDVITTPSIINSDTQLNVASVKLVGAQKTGITKTTTGFGSAGTTLHDVGGLATYGGPINDNFKRVLDMLTWVYDNLSAAGAGSNHGLWS